MIAMLSFEASETCSTHLTDVKTIILQRHIWNAIILKGLIEELKDCFPSRY